MSPRNQYFEDMKAFAREKRNVFGIQTSTLGLREVRRIYALEKIKIDAWPLPRKIKAVYMCEDSAYSVALQNSLPPEPKLFALIHELKHHFCDQLVLQSGEIKCGDYNANEKLEIGAEVFAAEFLYPEQDFEADALAFCSQHWTAEDIVRFKKQCIATVSYTFICKRLVRCGLISSNQYAGIKFKKLEEQIYGIPFYKQPWFKKNHINS